MPQGASIGSNKDRDSSVESPEHRKDMEEPPVCVCVWGSTADFLGKGKVCAKRPGQGGSLPTRRKKGWGATAGLDLETFGRLFHLIQKEGAVACSCHQLIPCESVAVRKGKVVFYNGLKVGPLLKGFPPFSVLFFPSQRSLTDCKHWIPMTQCPSAESTMAWESSRIGFKTCSQSLKQVSFFQTSLSIKWWPSSPSLGLLCWLEKIL